MYLLDPNVIFELRRPNKVDRNVVAWAASVPAAQFYGMTVVTRNVADFSATGVALLIPWDSLLA